MFTLEINGTAIVVTNAAENEARAAEAPFWGRIARGEAEEGAP